MFCQLKYIVFWKRFAEIMPAFVVVGNDVQDRNHNG